MALKKKKKPLSNAKKLVQTFYHYMLILCGGEYLLALENNI